MYSDATVTGATAHPVAAESPHRTLKGTVSCSNHSGTALYETHVAGQEESGCVLYELWVKCYILYNTETLFPKKLVPI